jgi:hypothetical protein
MVRRAMRAIVGAIPALLLTPKLIVNKQCTGSCFAAQFSAYMNRV